MPNLDTAFGIHELALKLRSQRTEMLSSNLANADTPGYKARDIDFKSALSAAYEGKQPGLRLTNTRHMATPGSLPGGTEAQYRIPNAPSIDGNTVDPQLEKAAFMENAINYQATLTFIDGKMKALKKALGGQ